LPQLDLARLQLSWPAIGAIAFTLTFIAISIWWVTQDLRLPQWDPGRHTEFALEYYDALRRGDFGVLLTLDSWPYPPLVHVVGAAVTPIFGRGIEGPVLSQNLVFVPLLALGCYHSARLAFDDSRAGLYAVLFALGTPMIVGQFHLFMLDPPQAAMAAISVWALLASRSFQHTGIAALAGAAVGLGLLTKISFVVFVAGVMLVMLIRGGWRHWRGLLAFSAAALVVAGPWYAVHLEDLRSIYNAGAFITPTRVLPGLSPPRFSADNAQWYLWTGLNYQYLVPLSLFAAIGFALALGRVVRRPSPHPLLLELLVGGFVGWFAVTWQLPHDVRYILPLLVYVAVLGGGWIVLLPRTGRWVVGSLLAIVATVNLLGASFGPADHHVSVALPNAPKSSVVMKGHFSFYEDDGYAQGEPRQSEDLLGVLRKLHGRGVRQVGWDIVNASELTFNFEGLRAYAAIVGFDVNITGPPFPRDSVFLFTKPTRPGQRPCVTMFDGRGVWMRYGDPLARPFRDACPR
jgi:4-amino-4-deoxy-L-arabinose transferase-like glycosyltransferase